MIEAKQFGDAMSLIKIGHRVTRVGWNGHGMWLVLISPGNAMHRSAAGSYDMAPCIGMKTAQNTMQPGWVPSQADMLASDWIDLDESEEPVVAEIANLRATIERSEAAHRAELSRVQGLLDDVAHAHERDILAIWKALGETHEPPENVGAILGRIETLRGAVAEAAGYLDGNHLVECVCSTMSYAMSYAKCDCAVGRDHAMLVTVGAS